MHVILKIKVYEFATHHGESFALDNPIRNPKEKFALDKTTKLFEETTDDQSA